MHFITDKILYIAIYTNRRLRFHLNMLEDSIRWHWLPDIPVLKVFLNRNSTKPESEIRSYVLWNIFFRVTVTSNNDDCDERIENVNSIEDII
jgi:hypothetical protein